MQNIDRNLVERFREGESDAFKELYERMHQRIYRYSLRWIGSREDAEDITVQTFTEAYRSRVKFLGHSSIETWLYRIAVHQAHRISRKRRNHEPLRETLVDASAQDTLTGIELEQLLLELTERQRAAFLLVRSEGLSYREASEVLGRPMGTVQSDVHEASKRLCALFFPKSPTADQVENYGYEL